jgi:predicted CXXCH cytochrome family protein
MRHALAVLTAGLVLGGLATANAQNPTVFPTNVYYMSKNVPTNIAAPYSAGGGVPAQALIASPVLTSNSWAISWYGMKGWSTVQGSTDLVNWVNLTNVAATNFSWTTTVPNTLDGAKYFHLSQNNAYASQSACAGCHADKYDGWTNTPHSYAITALLNPDGSFTSSHANPSCLLCHTVGDGQPTGYVYTSNSASYSSLLANVGCEDCHGPAGWHRASEKDMITPAVSLDPAICGSCHQGHHPQYTEYTNVNYTAISNAPMGILLAAASHANKAGSGSFGCSPCHAANNRMAMVKEYYDRLAGNPHPITLFASADSQAFGGAACATCHDPHGSNNVAQLRNPITSTNWFAVPSTVTDPTPVLTTNSNGSITTNSTSAMAYNTIFDSFYNPNIQICGQCHAGGRGMRWDGSAYGLITNTVVSNYVTQAGYVPVTTYVTNVEVFTNTSYGYVYTNGASVGVTNITIATNRYVIPYATNQVWMASVTNILTNSTLAVDAYYPLIPYTNNGTVYYSTNSSGEKTPHYPVQYNVLIGQLDYDLAARGGPSNVLTDAHALSPNQCADCHVPSYTSGGQNVTGHKFVCDYNSPTCLGCHASMTSNSLAAMTFNYKVSVSNSMNRVVSLLRQWGTNVAPAILATNYGPLAWEYPSINSYFSTKSTNIVNGVSHVFSVGPPSAWNKSGGQPSSTNDNLQLKYVPQDIRQIRFALNVLYEDQSYGVHNPTYTSNLLAWAENDVITNQFIAAGWPTFSANVVSGAAPLTVQFSNTGSGSVYSWTFGDGGTASTANPTYTYASGLYSVTCTVDGKSLTRTQYILVQ